MERIGHGLPDLSQTAQHQIAHRIAGHLAIDGQVANRPRKRHFVNFRAPPICTEGDLMRASRETDVIAELKLVREEIFQ